MYVLLQLHIFTASLINTIYVNLFQLTVSGGSGLQLVLLVAKQTASKQHIYEDSATTPPLQGEAATALETTTPSPLNHALEAPVYREVSNYMAKPRKYHGGGGKLY